MIILLSIVTLCSIILLFFSILPCLIEKIQSWQQKREHIPKVAK